MYIVTSYSFNKAAKTLTLTDLAVINTEAIKRIYNVQTNQVVHQYGLIDGIASTSGNVITLNDDGASRTYANSDEFVIEHEEMETSVGIRSRVAITRPADTVAYAAGDWVSNATSSGVGFVFTDIVPAGKAFYIDSMTLLIDATSVPSGMGGFTAWIFDGATTFNDNVARDLAYASMRDNGVGSVVFSTPVDVGSVLRATTEVKLVRRPAGGDLYVGLETLGAFTPASGTAFSLVIHGVIL